MTNYSELENLFFLLKEKITWNQRTFCFPIISKQKKVNKYKFKIISNKEMKSLFFRDFQAFIDSQEYFSFEEMIPTQSKDEDIKINKTKVNQQNNKTKELGNFLTYNNALKIFHIKFRFFSNIPVIFVDGNDYEKIFLIKYLVEVVMNQKLIIFLINPNTSEQDIIQFINQQEENTHLTILFHEINTASKGCIILLKEILLDRSCNGVPLDPKINLLASLKTFSQKEFKELQTKIQIQKEIDDANDNNSNSNNMDKELKNKKINETIIYPRLIPDSFYDEIFDFGSLENNEETKYISLIVERKLKEIEEAYLQKSLFFNFSNDKKYIFEIINYSRNYIQKEREKGFYLFYDVIYFVRVLSWILSNQSAETLIEQSNPSIRLKLSIPISLYFVYASNLIGNDRNAFLSGIENDLIKENIQETINKISNRAIQLFNINFSKRNIAETLPLKENILFILISFFTRIPLLINGKSKGTSRSIAFQIILDSFNRNSNQKNKFTKLEIIEIHCSELISSSFLKQKFEDAKKLENQQNIIPVIIFKEVENLKKEAFCVLHSEIRKNLSEEIISENSNLWIVLFSNLDDEFDIPAVVLNERKLNEKELEMITTEILGSLSKEFPEKYQQDFVAEFLLILNNKKEKRKSPFSSILSKMENPPTNIYDISDYYAFLKYIEYYYSHENQEKKSLSQIVLDSFFRNFGFRKKIPKNLFNENKLKELPDLKNLNLANLISGNIQTNQTNKFRIQQRISLQKNSQILKCSRHLMLVIPESSLFPFIQEKFFKDSILLFESNPKFESSSIRSNNIEKKKMEKEEEDEMIKNLMLIKNCISEGKLLVLFDYQKLYPFLYDLLHQIYYEKNKIVYTKIFLKNEAISVAMNPNFRLVIVTSKAIEYEFNQEKMLRHFEKQYVDFPLLFPLSENNQKLVEQLKLNLTRIESECKIYTQKEFVFGFNENFLPSIVMKYENEDDDHKLEIMKKKLFQFFIFGKMVQIDQMISKKSESKSILKKYFSQLDNSFDDLMKKEILSKNVQKSIIFTKSMKIKLGNLADKFPDYLFRVVDFEKENILEKEEIIEEFLNNCEKKKNFLVVHFTQNEIEHFIRMKVFIDEMITSKLEKQKNKDKKKNQKDQFYVIFFMHFSSDSRSQKISFQFEMNWEYFYLEELYPKLSLKNLPKSLLSIFDHFQQKQELENLWKDIIGVCLSKMVDSTSKSFKDFKTSFIELFLEEKKKEQVFQKIRRMIKMGIKNKHYIYDWNFSKLKKEKERPIPFRLFAKFMSILIGITDIFLSNINLNGDLFELLSPEKNVNRELWFEMFELYQIPYFKILDNKNHGCDEEKRIETKVPFAFQLYLSIQNPQKEPNVFFKTPLDTPKNKQIYKEYLEDFIKLTLKMKKYSIFNSLKIHLRRWMLKFQARNKKHSFQKIHSIYFEKIHQNLNSILEISPLINYSTKKKSFSLLLFMQELMKKIQEDKEIQKEMMQRKRSSQITNLFKFLVEIENKEKESENESENQNQIEELNNIWLLELFKYHFNINLETLNSKENYSIMEKKFMVNKISEVLLKKIFHKPFRYKNLFICKASEEKELPVYITLKPKKEEEEEKCPICRKKTKDQDSHFEKVEKKDRMRSRKSIKSTLEQFAQCLSFYGELIFEKFVLNEQITGNYNIALIQEYLDYLQKKAKLLLLLNSKEVLYSVYIPFFRNLLFLSDKKKVFDFIDSILIKTDLQPLKDKIENVNLLCCMKTLEEDYRLREKIRKVKQERTKQKKDSSPRKSSLTLSQISTLISQKKNCERNPKKMERLIKKRKILKVSGKEILRKMFQDIYNLKGRDGVIGFIENEAPEKVRSLEITKGILSKVQSFPVIQNIISKRKLSLQYYYDQYKIGNDLSSQFRKTHIEYSSENKIGYVESILYRNFWEIEKRFENKEIFKMMLHSIELIDDLKIQPFNFLFSSDMISEVGEPKIKQELLEKLYWPLSTSYDIPEKYRNEQNSWELCEKKHLNFTKFSHIKLQNWCEFCHENMQGTEVEESFFMNTLSYSFPKYINKNPSFTVRDMDPKCYRIVFLLMHLSIIPFIIISEKFSNHFISLINNFVFKPETQQELETQFISHIENSLSILSGLMDLTQYQTIIYYHKFLDLVSKKKIPSVFLNKEKFKQMETRKSMEDFFQEIYKQNDKELMQEVNQEIPREIMEISQKIEPDLFSFEKTNFDGIINLYHKNKEEPKEEPKRNEYPLTHFVIENMNQLKILNLFGGFVKFASFLIQKVNGKITREESKRITIQNLIAREGENVLHLFSEFKRFWKRCSKELRSLQIIKDIPNSIFKNEIDEGAPIEICLPGKEKENLQISILIEYSIELHNRLIFSKDLESIFGENKVEIKSKIKFPVDLDDFNSSQFLRFDMQDFIKNNFVSELVLVEKRIKETFCDVKQKVEFDFEIENFSYLDQKPELETDFLQKTIWKQKDMKIYQWKRIEKEAGKHGMLRISERIIGDMIESCKRIRKEENISKVRKMKIFEMIRNSYFEDIEKFSPSFKQFAKIKHLLFIHKKLKENTEKLINSIPKKFRVQMTNFQMNELKKSLEKIHLNDFLGVFEGFIKKIGEQFNRNYPIRDLLLLSIEDKKSKIYIQTEEYFDLNKTIFLGNCLSIRLYYWNIFKI
ncbi:e3 ubiquitin-protein ligase rnf213 [Anaeramoeba ignava]|uniref:E3 ubiquitin-protein ligase rnf213 n=1 Tax=Anaeramoeba ignava TaxID=1746090 RepID=A0A9Q0LQX0_ANAIG|nr:e3 ubiquitin-protein ligase rnf213 [Anaeramoeba ignava]